MHPKVCIVNTAECSLTALSVLLFVEHVISMAQTICHESLFVLPQIYPQGEEENLVPSMCSLLKKAGPVLCSLRTKDMQEGNSKLQTPVPKPLLGKQSNPQSFSRSRNATVPAQSCPLNRPDDQNTRACPKAKSKRGAVTQARASREH